MPWSSPTPSPPAGHSKSSRRDAVARAYPHARVRGGLDEASVAEAAPEWSFGAEDSCLVMVTGLPVGKRPDRSNVPVFAR